MKKLIISIISFVFVGVSADAQSQSLTLEDCLTKALEYNKSLSSAKLKLEKTTFDMKSYKANFFPQFNLLATDFYSTAKGDFTIDGGHLPIYNYVESLGQFVPNVTMNSDGSYTLNQYADFPSQTMKWKLKNFVIAGISVVEPIYSGGKISTAYQMSKLGINMANENIRLTESEVIVKTHEAYYLAVKAHDLGDVARSYKALLEELKKNVEGAFRHGMSTRNDIMKVQVKLNEAELSIQKADNGYRLALMNLCHIIGIPLDSQVELGQEEKGSSEALSDGRHLDSRSIENRPEYFILENKTELAHQQVKLTRSDYLPNVAVGATYTYANGGELAGKKMIDNGAAAVGVAVKMPLDIFGGGTNKVRSAKAAYQIAQLEQQDLNEQMQLELAQCQNIYEETQTELHLCEMSLEQAAENMRLSKQQYEVGFEPLSDYLETQALWQQCSANLVNARCQLQLSRVKLLKASGKLR
ncbi:MAG: TolC family protein [Bacteroidaceae bacterium]|nr:TolC family protein [Bacteroidaceae bacterium]MBR1669024.1 TolC family protein [Bacteroidaceae bacterium]